MRWEEIVEGQTIPRFADEVSYLRVVLNAGVIGDYFRGHHDVDYARAHGHPTVFLNTIQIMGFVDRVATAWAGPHTRVRRRRVALRNPVYAGDTMVAEGRVTRRWSEPGPEVSQLVEVAIDVTNQRGEPCCTASVILQFAATPQVYITGTSWPQ
jgi:MaoC like domain